MKSLMNSFRSLPFTRGGGVGTGIITHALVFFTITFTIFGFSGSVSVSDHSLLSELSDDSEEISLFISTFGGSFILNSESVAHSSGGFDLFSGGGHNNTFLKDASVHVIDVTRESGFEGTK